MVDIKALLPELKKLVTDLFEDLLVRSTENAKVDAGLREAYTQIEKGGRTADAFEVWREDYLDQVAVAWVLGCVFVRFMEDNHLIDECWLAGHGKRRKLAEDTHELYFRDHPHKSDREYFEHVFREVGKIPACRDLFAEGKTPLWAIGPSGDAAMKLLAFWQEPVPETGELKRSFDVEDGDTRFLGDLYQDLSERARKKYALLQTPVFVEEFILDRTLDPAIDEFGLDEVRMIDPTCGSGHFLLGGFARLFGLWIKVEDNDVVAAQKALDGVWGVDINPFAIAIARFRLIVAAIRACNIIHLKDAPAWDVHLATGDSLLFGNRWTLSGGKKTEQQFFETDEESWAPKIYACEDKDAVQNVLGQQYHAVVGNPPYIIERDRNLNEAYRNRYSTCFKKYSLAVPFAERFFDLAVQSPDNKAGYVGTITANSFMKREFGKKLVEKFFPRVDLTTVVDTTGAYIPGHTTSTVIFFGRSRSPIGETIRAVLGIQGEQSTPDDPAQGIVWRSICDLVDRSGDSNSFVESVDIKRSTLAKHPWNLTGGGAVECLGLIENSTKVRLGDLVDSIGPASFPGLDDAFVANESFFHRAGIEAGKTRPFVCGDSIRNWQRDADEWILTPYDENHELLPLDECSKWFKHLWRNRTSLENVVSFGGKTRKEIGESWWAWYRWISARYRHPLIISFGFVATHNHFAIENEQVAFNRSSPVVLLKRDSSKEDHVRLASYLNSSLAGFWMKQKMTCKGLGGQGGGIKPEHWSRQYEFAGTMMKKLPVPAGSDRLLEIGTLLVKLEGLSKPFCDSNEAGQIH